MLLEIKDHATVHDNYLLHHKHKQAAGSMFSVPENSCFASGSYYNTYLS
jgi:hypothetical protein